MRLRRAAPSANHENRTLTKKEITKKRPKYLFLIIIINTTKSEFIKIKSKSKVVPVLNKVPRHEDIPLLN
jgi:hypothetical protein